MVSLCRHYVVEDLRDSQPVSLDVADTTRYEPAIAGSRGSLRSDNRMQARSQAGLLRGNRGDSRVPLHVSASTVTTMCLNAGVFDSGSTARGISTFDSGQYIMALPGRMSNGRTS